MVGTEHVSTDELDLICYARDMAPMPDDLLRGYGMIQPQAVVRPGSAEEVAKILKWASEKKVPVTPRAGGSWALGGTIPVEGGVVMDISRLDRIIELNKEDGWVRVEGCLAWKRLSDVLEREGLRVGTYPSSAPSAAIAGFIATGGSGGIGAPKHGPVGDQILSMRVALTDGRVVETDPWSSWLFTGSEGTLGVICEVTLKVFPIEPTYSTMLAFDDAAEGWKAFNRLYELRPYFLTFIDKGFARSVNKAAAMAPSGHGGHGEAEKPHPVPEKKIAFVATFTGPDEDLARIRSEVEYSWPDALCDEELAVHEWESRFDAVLATKRIGPTIFSPEVQVPIAGTPAVFDRIEQIARKRDRGMEGMAIGGGNVTILPIIYTDERSTSGFLKVFSYTRGITDVAYSRGGCIYGIGLHNSAHMAKIHKRGLKVMRKIRAQLEPSNMLNPSKTTQVRVRYVLLRVAMFFMAWAPWAVALGLMTTRLVPRSCMRLGLRMVGSKLR
jgi:FAD/FMN-containing dehydrogenase